MSDFRDKVYGPNDSLPGLDEQFPEGMRPVGGDDDDEERVHPELAPRLRKYRRRGIGIVEYNVEINHSRVGDMITSRSGARVKFDRDTDFVEFPNAEEAEKAFIQKWKDAHKPYSDLALSLLGQRCTLDGNVAEITDVHKPKGCVNISDEMGYGISMSWSKIDQIMKQRGGTFIQEDEER